MYASKQQKQTGFTLIELMVAVSIFAIVLLIALGSILTVVDSNRKARTLTEVMNNVNFTLESMTRTIKTGVDPQYDPSEGILSVVGIDLSAGSFDRQTISYRRSETGGGRGFIEKRTGNGIWIPVTSDQVNVKSMEITVVGERNPSSLVSVADLDQPRTQLTIDGEVTITEKISSSFVIQTTVSQRKLNLTGSEE